MALRIIITVGLPASGKSTWAREVVQKDGTFVRVNKDDLRAMLHDGKWSAKREDQIIAMRDVMIKTAFQAKLNVIVDDTNLHPKHIQRITEIAKAHQAQVEIKRFDVDVDECVKRDAKRPNPVGEKVIRDMYKKFILGAPPSQETAGKRPAIIVDMDGTLAIIGDRSPYDDQFADRDSLNHGVAEIVQGYLKSDPYCVLIIMSGRDEGRSREVTEKWLADHGICPKVILMRPAGDTRKDSIIKKELFENFVRPFFYVRAVFDDRNQVVNMWRDELGLLTLQVANGDF